MPHVVFVRAANVGGRNVFRPAQLVTALAHLDVVNVGAAGTFLVRGKSTAAAIRKEILSRLAFEPEIAIRPTSEIRDLIGSSPFAHATFSKDQRGWAAVLTERPKARPDLPILAPPGKAWCVRVDRLDGAFVLGLWRRRPSGFVFPNQIVEKAFGSPATTRWWETLERIGKLIDASS